MSISYQDKNLIVTYIQVLMKERAGETVHKVIPKGRSNLPYYEVTQADPLLVNGRYNTQTYSAVALYMAKNYPNEGFPYISYIDDEGSLKYKNFYYQGVIVENLAGDGTTSKKFTVSNTQGVNPFSYISVIYYETSSEGKYLTEVSTDKEWDRGYNVYRFTDSSHSSFEVKLEENKAVGASEYIEVKYDNLVDVISSNMEMTKINRDSILLSDRVLSYLMNEVVSDISSPEEIIRIKKLLSGTVNFNPTVLSYDIADIICQKQRDFISMYAGPESSTYEVEVNNCKFNNKFIVDSNIDNIELSIGEKKVESSYYDYDYITGVIEFSSSLEVDNFTVSGSKMSDIDLPDYYKELKITGYVDPITELILKQGVDDDE